MGEGGGRYVRGRKGKGGMTEEGSNGRGTEILEQTTSRESMHEVVYQVSQFLTLTPMNARWVHTLYMLFKCHAH